jgi:hypothetical protein
VFSLVLALAVAANFIHISANYHIKPLRTHGGDPKIPQILLNEGLTYGYSDFWHAAINTFTSKETVRVRQIACMGGRIGPFHWISSEQWYRPDVFLGKTFLLVDYHGAGKPIFEKCSRDMIINQFGMPEKQLQFDVDGSSLLLMIFNYNISQHF